MDTDKDDDSSTGLEGLALLACALAFVACLLLAVMLV